MSPAPRRRRLVVKIGSALLTATDGGFDVETFAALAGEIGDLVNRGHEIVVVSSGAISLGLAPLGYSERPGDIATLQAAAAVGQSHLMAAYDRAFSSRGRGAAQVLLTHPDLADRRRYLNARRALCTLIERGLIPVVNENDTVSVDEIKVGDNDSLAAEVVGLVDADLLVLLTVVDGLYDGDPDAADVRLVERVSKIDDALREAAGGAGRLGTGGMVTKLRAAELAAGHGAPTVLASGRRRDVISAAVDGECLGTFFDLGGRLLGARKRWIGQTLRAQGALVVDAGARRALVEQKRSLLPIGVLEVRGDFARGDLVTIEEGGGVVIGRGLVAYDADEARRIAGHHADKIEALLGFRFSDEVVHRDDLVIEVD